MGEAVEAKGLVHEQEMQKKAAKDKERQDWKEDYAGLEERIMAAQAAG